MINSEKKRKRPRRSGTVSFYIQFVQDVQTDIVLNTLERAGASVWEIDEDVDLEHFPQGGVFHPSAVFRLRLRDDVPAEELMAAAAHQPVVYSVTQI